jgi:hypothetical protein
MRLAVAVIAAFAVLAPGASANQFQRLYNDFKGDGVINGCGYSPGQLQRGASEIPPDVEQYAPSFADQLAAARQRQAAGRCGGGAAPAERAAAAAEEQAGSAGGGSDRPRGRGVSKPPAPKRPVETTLAGVPSPRVSASAASTAGSDAPAPVWILAALAGLAVLALVAAMAVRSSGLSAERYSRPFGASASEARDRVADALVEFWDWLRLGR